MDSRNGRYTQSLIQILIALIILEYVAEQLEFEQLGKQTMTHSLFGDTRITPQEHICYWINLRPLDNSYAWSITRTQFVKIFYK